MKNRKLYRLSNDRKIAGVASGLAEYFNIDPLLVRIIFVVVALSGGVGLLAYLLIAIFVPSK